MTHLFQTAMVFAVLIGVLGLFSVYGNGRAVDFAFADGHDGGDCCDAPPDDGGSHDEPAARR